jgi:hypothetical protein
MLKVLLLPRSKHFVSVRKPPKLTLYEERDAVCSGNYTFRAEFIIFSVKGDGT